MTRLTSAFHAGGELQLRTALAICLLALIFGATGCEKKSASKQTPRETTTKPAPAQPQQHAPAGARPGSHEDWCGGHQVPESLCTRCNASLIAAFKATGDWCNKHQLPESQCLVCNPGLKIVRPPPAGGRGKQP